MSGCTSVDSAKREAEEEDMTENTVNEQESGYASTGVPGEFIALTDTEEEALKLAEEYGIKLKDHSYGVAVFTTDKTIEELNRIAGQKGLPVLSVNGTVSINDNQ